MSDSKNSKLQTLAVTTLVAVLLVSRSAGAAAVDLRDLRLWAGPDSTRLVLELSGPATHTVFTLHNPDRVVIDIGVPKPGTAKLVGAIPAGQGLVRKVRVGDREGGGLRVVLDLNSRVKANSFIMEPNDSYGRRVVVDLTPPGARATSSAASNRSGKNARHSGRPEESAAGELSHIASDGSNSAGNSGVNPSGSTAVKIAHAPGDTGRDLVIAIDAGHGGEDPGAIGRAGTCEKDVVLGIARALRDRINREEGLHAILIRNGDYYVGLRDRMYKAREQNADLFVSVHADSIRDRSIAGSSVYILSPHGASSEAARWLAERENAADLIGGVSLDDKDKVLASVLLDLSQTASLTASMTAAEQVLHELGRIGEVRKHSIQQAGFMVLKSPDIPSMLIETAYISNPTEEHRLRTPAHQERLAAAIYGGIRGYFFENPPAGTRFAALHAAKSARVASEPRTDAGTD